MKKKIGIITFHNAHNYGAVLQVFALQNILAKENEVKIINYENKAIVDTYKLFKINKKNIVTILKSLLGDFIYYFNDKKRFVNFNNFIEKNLNLTELYLTEKQLKDNSPKLDIYITGSDQVWNYDIARNVDAYTLNFGQKDIKRISYAASIGEDKFEEQHIEQYKRNIQQIDFISVREKLAKPYLEKLVKKDITVTLDPTLLMKSQDWDKYLEKNEKKEEKYIFAYVVEENDEYYKILNYLSEITGYKIIHTGRRNKKINNILENAYTKGPLDFVSLIKNAEYVVATSFHATAFSILYHKKFWIIPHLKTGGRVTSLLEQLDISNRAISTFNEFKSKNFDEEINYKEVDEKLDKERSKSLNWLKNAIQ